MTREAIAPVQNPDQNDRRCLSRGLPWAVDFRALAEPQEGATPTTSSDRYPGNGPDADLRFGYAGLVSNVAILIAAVHVSAATGTRACAGT